MGPRRVDTPDDATLVHRLEAALSVGSLTLVSREVRYSGSFPKELVTLRSRGGQIHRFFCKYEAPRDTAHGHRGGVEHEARVYRELLSRRPSSTPRFVASGRDSSGEAWLILEALEGADRLKHDWSSLPAAARWLGEFHAQAAGDLPSTNQSFPPIYDREYFSGWGTRVLRFATGRGLDAPWLDRIVARFLEMVPDLMDPDAQTIIHGEFTPKNVLTLDGQIVPTDWESAAIAAGEIDLACLLDGCAAPDVDSCLLAYQAARWPEGASSSFRVRFRAARIYTHLRWLGERSDDLIRDGMQWRLRDLERMSRGMASTAAREERP